MWKCDQDIEFFWILHQYIMHQMSLSFEKILGKWEGAVSMSAAAFDEQYFWKKNI